MAGASGGWSSGAGRETYSPDLAHPARTTTKPIDRLISSPSVFSCQALTLKIGKGVGRSSPFRERQRRLDGLSQHLDRLDVLCLVGPVGFDGEVGGDAAVF